MNTKDEEKGYKELYKKAMLHIANLEIALDRQSTKLNFYQKEIEILEAKIKEQMEVIYNEFRTTKLQG